MGDKNKTAPVVSEADIETYLEWKATLARAWKTPEDMIKLYKSLGMAEYAAELEIVIQRMEDAVEGRA